jgi:predicted transcriptional regulator
MKDKVLDIFMKADQPLKAGEIADKYNLDKKGVDKAIKELKTEGKIHSPKRCFYAIKN